MYKGMACVWDILYVCYSDVIMDFLYFHGFDEMMDILYVCESDQITNFLYFTVLMRELIFCA